MASTAPEMTIRDYARVLLRRRWVVLVSVLFSTVTATGLSVVQTPIFEATAEVLIQPRGSDGLFDDQASVLNERSVRTEIQIAEGEAVRQRVVEDLVLAAPPLGIRAASDGQTDVISITARSTNADNARLLANAHAQAYVDIRREQSVAELLAASTEVQRAIDSLQEQIDLLAEDDPRRGTLVTQAANFSTTLDQLRVDAALRTGGASIIRSAELPTDPVEPTPLRTTTLALVVGLLIGFGAAFLIDYLDDKVRREEDLENLTDRAVIGLVPVDPPPDNRPISITAPDHASAEAYRGLRTNVQFLGLDKKLNVIQVTSSLAGEGKTTTATNLATVLAQAGHRVALVDADLRRPRVHQVFGVPVSPGLTDLLLGAQAKDVARTIDIKRGDTLTVYASGEVPSNPSEMLSGRRMKRLLELMGEHYDYVIVDSAPVLPVSDSVALSGAVEGVLLVAHAGRVRTGEVEESLERLQRVAAPLIGLVLNQAADEARDSYSYGGYGAPTVDRKAGKVRNEADDTNEIGDPVFAQK